MTLPKPKPNTTNASLQTHVSTAPPVHAAREFYISQRWQIWKPRAILLAHKLAALPSTTATREQLTRVLETDHRERILQCFSRSIPTSTINKRALDNPLTSEYTFNAALAEAVRFRLDRMGRHKGHGKHSVIRRNKRQQQRQQQQRKRSKEQHVTN